MRSPYPSPSSSWPELTIGQSAVSPDPAGEFVGGEAGGATREHDRDARAAGAPGDGAGSADVDAQLGDRRAGAAARAGPDDGGHLVAESGEEFAGDRVAVEGVHGSASCRSEALGLDAVGSVAAFHQQLRGGLDERGRPAHVGARPLLRRPCHGVDERAVDAPAMARPAGGPRPRQRDLDDRARRRRRARAVPRGRSRRPASARSRGRARRPAGPPHPSGAASLAAGRCPTRRRSAAAARAATPPRRSSPRSARAARARRRARARP